MNNPAKNSKLDQSSSNLQINFREGLPQRERELAERSVATLVSNATEKFAKVRAAEAERAKVTAALNAPIQKLIEQDPEAVKAIDSLRNGYLIDQDSKLAFAVEPPAPLARRPIIQFGPLNFQAIAIRPIDVRVPPYDFQWSWHLPDGFPPADQLLDKNTGRVGLSAASGPGGVSGFINAHAGFGLSLFADRDVTAIGRSLRIMHYGYSLNAIGVDSSATSEGGLEFTALEDGTLINIVSEKLWRKRVSSTDENTFFEAGPHAVFEPQELAFEMR